MEPSILGSWTNSMQLVFGLEIYQTLEIMEVVFVKVHFHTVYLYH